MATYTTRNDLIKPEYTDAADVEDFNDNMDFIDGSIAPCTWDATAAPTANDDVTLGYIIGSMWFDVTNHKLYMCEDNTDTAAVWRQLYPAVLTGAVLANGTVPLTADWDAGSFEIRAQTFESDVTTGTAPLVVASTTKVDNLNAATVNGHADTAFLHADGTINATGTINSTLAVGTAPITVTSTTKCTNLNADLLDDLNSTAFAILAGQAGGQTLTGGTATTNNLTLLSNSAADGTGVVKIPNGGLEIGTKATTATYGAINIHEGASGEANEINFLDGDGSTVRASIWKTSGDVLSFASGDGTTVDMALSTSGVLTLNGGLYMVRTDWSNPANYTTGLTNAHTVAYTTTDTLNFYSVNGSIYPTIAKSYTNSGTLYGLQFNALRNNAGASADDDGAVTALTSMYMAFGHYNANASMAGTTTTAYGIRLQPYWSKGTITNVYGIRIEAPSTGGTATNQYPFYSLWDAQSYWAGDMYTAKNMSALSFTDRTPWYEGDGIADLKKIKGKDGQIDHDTLPDFAKKIIDGKPNQVNRGKKAGADGIEYEEVEIVGKNQEVGRDLGAMISILTKAVIQLTDKIDDLTTRVEKLEKKA